MAALALDPFLPDFTNRDLPERRRHVLAAELAALHLGGEHLDVPLGSEPSLISLPMVRRAVTDTVTRYTGRGFVLTIAIAENPDTDTRILSNTKSNYTAVGRSVEFRIAGVTVPSIDVEWGTVEWLGDTTMNARTYSPATTTMTLGSGQLPSIGLRTT
ncbi:hypothetical protein [Mycolicibacterium brisbanense]|uniref:Uncharacterized protein n=1 Tax=Mycolicibacterium brisbanense TaxID=146020 RepID=A0A100W6B1_9MYCO|nr:hypothetical protein [Mycolicibacterium brisbanense]GAS92421.1 uncharacterized protein RMCB_6517 [Mycolicibacterium brisbanense]